VVGAPLPTALLALAFLARGVHPLPLALWALAWLARIRCRWHFFALASHARIHCRWLMFALASLAQREFFRRSRVHVDAGLASGRAHDPAVPVVLGLRPENMG
jgi:hypothetical protein